MEFLIPAGVAVRIANEHLGTSFSTMQDIAAYLDANPEKRKLLEANPDCPHCQKLMEDAITEKAIRAIAKALEDSL